MFLRVLTRVRTIFHTKQTNKSRLDEATAFPINLEWLRGVDGGRYRHTSGGFCASPAGEEEEKKKREKEKKEKALLILSGPVIQ